MNNDTVYKLLAKYYSNRKDEIFHTVEIKRTLHIQYGINTASVIPSDYCYNYWNKGIGPMKPLFIRIRHGEYKYVGSDYKYNGNIFWCPKGRKPPQIVGKWVNGQCTMF